MDCGGFVAIRHGLYVCTSCGLQYNSEMVGDYIPPGAEDERRVAHLGPPSAAGAYRIGDLGTTIGPRLSFRSAKEKHAYAGLRRARKWGYTSSERCLLDALLQLKGYCDRLNLPHHVRDFAVQKYKEALEKGLVQGRRRELSVVALLYDVCQHLRIPRTLTQLCSLAMEEKESFEQFRRGVYLAAKKMARGLGLHPRVLTPMDYIHQVGSAAMVPEDLTARAVRKLEPYWWAGVFAGYSRTGVAAAAIAAQAADEEVPVSLEGLAAAANVTPVTIKKISGMLRGPKPPSRKRFC